MKTLSVLIAISTLAASLGTAKAEVPPKLEELNAKYAAAVENATEPLKQTYLGELKKLLDEYTKQGNLEAALEVKTILDEISPEPEAADATDELPAAAGKTTRSRRLYKGKRPTQTIYCLP